MQWCYTKLDQIFAYKHVYSPTIGITFILLCNQKSQKKLFRGYINNVILAGINDLARTTQPQIVDIEPIKYSRSTCIFCGWVLLAENLLHLRLNFAANYTIMTIYIIFYLISTCTILYHIIL